MPVGREQHGVLVIILLHKREVVHLGSTPVACGKRLPERTERIAPRHLIARGSYDIDVSGLLVGEHLILSVRAGLAPHVSVRHPNTLNGVPAAGNAPADVRRQRSFLEIDLHPAQPLAAQFLPLQEYVVVRSRDEFIYKGKRSLGGADVLKRHGEGIRL